MVKSSLIGLGEVGGGLYAILKDSYEIKWFNKDSEPNYTCEIMHVCIPWSDEFYDEVIRYVEIQCPKVVVVHSSVPVGTCDRLREFIKIHVYHSPVRGKHPDMMGGIKNYIKYIGSDSIDEMMDDWVCNYFKKAGINVKLWNSTKATELAKLLELCRYGTYISFAKEQERICEKFGLDYNNVVMEYEETRTNGLMRINRIDLVQPVLYPFKDYIGGHCTIEDMEILLSQVETPILREAYEIGRNTKVWANCNVYKSAKIGKGCNIGTGSEIGHKVIIGNNVRIGAMCFIPEGVTIEDDCFIAPRVSFSNDKNPPSKKEDWGSTTVKKGAAIGMGSIILPGVTIGEGAIIGAGSVVTKDVGPNEKWFGVPAYKHGLRNK